MRSYCASTNHVCSSVSSQTRKSLHGKTLLMQDFMACKKLSCTSVRSAMHSIYYCLSAGIQRAAGPDQDPAACRPGCARCCVYFWQDHSRPGWASGRGRPVQTRLVDGRTHAPPRLTCQEVSQGLPGGSAVGCLSLAA